MEWRTVPASREYIRLPEPALRGSVSFPQWCSRDDLNGHLRLWSGHAEFPPGDAVELRVACTYELVIGLLNGRDQVRGLRVEHVPMVCLICTACWLRKHGAALLAAGKPARALGLPHLVDDGLVFTTYAADDVKRWVTVRGGQPVCADRETAQAVREALLEALAVSSATWDELVETVPWPPSFLFDARSDLQRSDLIVQGADGVMTVAREYALMRKNQAVTSVSIGEVHGPVHAGTGDIYWTQVTVQQALTAIAEKAEATGTPEGRGFGQKIREAIRDFATDVAAKSLAEVLRRGS